MDKLFEIRTFYLKRTCYSSAIFSQNDEKTKVDFRNYNYENPNRTPPFRLPKNIEKSIDLLMKKLDMTSGSLDFVYTKSKKFVFLEVNPIGQFQQVSLPCNYYLEKQIALAL